MVGAPGYYANNDGVYGFLYFNGTYTTLTDPASSQGGGVYDTYALGLNNKKPTAVLPHRIGLPLRLFDGVWALILRAEAR